MLRYCDYAALRNKAPVIAYFYMDGKMLKRLMTSCLAVLPLFMVPIICDAQTSSSGPSIPAFLQSKAVYKLCNPTGADDVPTLLNTVGICLLKQKQFIATMVVAKAVRDYGSAHEYDDMGNYEEIRSAVQTLDEQIQKVADLESQTPEMPAIDSGFGQCGEQIVRDALSQSGALYQKRMDAVRAVTANPSLSFDIVTTEGYSFDIDQQAQGYLTSPQGGSALGKCFFAEKDWHKAAKYYAGALHGGDGATPSDYWHLAIAMEHLGDRKSAKAYIRTAYRQIGDSGALAKQIKYDYNRLGDAKEDAIAAQRAAAEARREQQAAAHEALAENHEYWDGLSYDEQRVIAHYGGTRGDNGDARPCSVSSSDSTYVGHLVIWYYDCISDGGIGKESWTFLNGTLTEHTSL